MASRRPVRLRSDGEGEMLAQFGQFYADSTLPVNQQIELDVCGCSYGGVGWATRDQIDRLAQMLDLGPDDHLMDLGAGAGWPGLYLAKEAGCRVVLLDLPHEGLAMAAGRARAEGLDGQCLAAVADGETLPCADGVFDVVTHSDVLCCLPGKREVLKECARVLLPQGQMIFSVIYIEPGLTGADFTRAVEAGPPYIEADVPYETLLEESGWEISTVTDLTAAYLKSVEVFFRSTEENREAYIDAYGQEGFDERMSVRDEVIRAITLGHMKRALYQVVRAGTYA